MAGTALGWDASGDDKKVETRQSNEEILMPQKRLLLQVGTDNVVGNWMR